jgi:hypothetical protein
VRRWEKREGLPVHRHLHDRRDSMYAFPAELDGWLEGRQNTAPVGAQPQHRAWPGAISLSLAIAAAVVLSGALVAVTYLRSPPDTGSVRVPFLVPHLLILADAATGGDFSISPDGRRLAFVAEAVDGTRRLWIRPLDSLAAVPLAESEGAVGTATTALHGPLRRVCAQIFRPVYVPGRGGHKFLVNVVVEETTASPVTMILNWPAAMPRR